MSAGAPGIEIEHHHGGTFDVVLARERSVQLEIGEVRRPNQCRQILRETIIHHAIVAFAPHFGRLHPFRSMRRTILFVKKFAFHAVGIALHGERPIFEMRQEDWRDADVVIDYLAFGESDLRIKHLVQVRHLNLAVFDD